MRSDFCAFILSHGRPDKVKTLETLLRCGYTGDIRIIVDDEDKTLEEYKSLHGDMVYVFNKAEAAEYTDAGDNFQRRDTVLYARNASFGIAKELGYKYFIQLDDDYNRFNYMFRADRHWDGGSLILNLDAVFEAMLEFYEGTNLLSLCMCQKGDYIGGSESRYAGSIMMARKAMNSFICSVDRPFKFMGRMNDDVNTYTRLGHDGHLMMSFNYVALNQPPTQGTKGGLTEMYLDFGTYAKSFYTIMYAPACAIVTGMGASIYRLHHMIRWDATWPKIMREKHRKSISKSDDTA